MNIASDVPTHANVDRPWRMPYSFGAACLFLCLVAVIWGLIVHSLSQEYQKAERVARSDAALLSRIMEENLLRSIEAIDAQLRLLRDLYINAPSCPTIIRLPWLKFSASLKRVR